MSQPLTHKERDIANQSRLLAGLPDDLRDSLLDAARVVRYRRGETIFHQGDRARTLHVLTEGWIKIYRITPSGTETVIHIFHQGQCFGSPVALQRLDYPVSAEAATDCRVIHVIAEKLLAILNAHPEVAIAVIATTLTHLQDMVDQVEYLKARSGAKRVAAFLLDLCPQGVTDSAIVQIPYDKGLIAGNLGMQRESLSRAFGKLRQYGVNVDNNQAMITSVTGLRDWVLAET